MTVMSTMFIVAAFLFGGSLVVSAQSADISYDPYADRVTAVGVATTTSNRDRATGAPDGRSATISGNNNSITLDMGEGEEGAGSLRLHFGSLVAQTQVRVTFIDRDAQEINTQTGTLVVALGPGTQDFPFRFSDFGKAYRYVRITSLRDSGFILDAVTASDYIGEIAGTDTDGDGIADRTESRNGTDPQVVSQTPPPPPTPTPDTTAPIISNATSVHLSPTSQQIIWRTNEGATSQVEYGPASPSSRSPFDARLLIDHSVVLSGLAPGTWYTFHVISRDQAGNETISVASSFITMFPAPPASLDKDRDGMPDTWEAQYNLNSASSTDASTDLDSDGLTNLQEYQIGSDPSKSDTDSDGMPDGWEKNNNFLVTKDDAAADPDVDGVSNLTEYQNGTDPHNFDESTATSTPTGTTDSKSNSWVWWLLGAIVVIVVITSLTRPRVGTPPSTV